MSHSPKITISMREYSAMLGACKQTLSALIENGIHLPLSEQALMNAIQKVEGQQTLDALISEARQNSMQHRTTAAALTMLHSDNNLSDKFKNALPEVLERCKIDTPK